MKHWPSILIIIVSAVLMQWHSIAFWLEYAGHTGVGFSLALEVVALWLWWQRRSFLAVVASALLVGGPLFQLSQPVMETMASTNVNQAMVASYKQEINQLNNSLSRYDENSAKRLGWSSRIDKAQEKLSHARNKLRELLSVKTSETPLRLYMIVLMQALALIIIMRAQIIAITTLPLISAEPSSIEKYAIKVDKAIKAGQKIESKRHLSKQTKDEPPRKNPKPDADTQTEPKNNETTDFDERVIKVATWIRENVKNYEGKQRAMADDIDVRPADLSLILNHTDRKERGSELISEPKLLKIEKVMEAI